MGYVPPPMHNPRISPEENLRILRRHTFWTVTIRFRMRARVLRIWDKFFNRDAAHLIGRPFGNGVCDHRGPPGVVRARIIFLDLIMDLDAGLRRPLNHATVTDFVNDNQARFHPAHAACQIG
jgi:hypothetical protein